MKAEFTYFTYFHQVIICIVGLFCISVQCFFICNMYYCMFLMCVLQFEINE